MYWICNIITLTQVFLDSASKNKPIAKLSYHDIKIGAENQASTKLKIMRLLII